MHRMIEASIQPGKTDVIARELEQHRYVVGLNILRNTSVKPKGDTITIHVLNKGVDDVLRIIHSHISNEPFSIITSEVASISNRQSQKDINDDVDEAIWEEMETGLRHNGKLTQNFMMLMGIGGIIAAVGFISEVQNQVIAFVAASIIAPALEPVAKIPLGIVLKNKDVLWTGLKASFVGYLLIILSAALTFFILLQFGEVTAKEFLDNSSTKSLMQLKLKDFLLSFAAAAASILMYLSFRRNVIAGPLIALILIPATSAIGMSLVIGEWTNALELFKRLGLDILLVIIMGLVLMYLKQKLVHKRKPLR